MVNCCLLGNGKSENSSDVLYIDNLNSKYNRIVNYSHQLDEGIFLQNKIIIIIIITLILIYPLI